MLSAEFNPIQNFRMELSGTSIYHDISDVSGLDDHRRGGWQALSLDFRYRFLDRERAGFGLLIDAEPRWARIDETTGEPVDQYEECQCDADKTAEGPNWQIENQPDDRMQDAFGGRAQDNNAGYDVTIEYDVSLTLSISPQNCVCTRPPNTETGPRSLL